MAHWSVTSLIARKIAKKASGKGTAGQGMFRTAVAGGLAGASVPEGRVNGPKKNAGGLVSGGERAESVHRASRAKLLRPPIRPKAVSGGDKISHGALVAQ